MSFRLPGLVLWTWTQNLTGFDSNDFRTGALSAPVTTNAKDGPGTSYMVKKRLDQ